MRKKQGFATVDFATSPIRTDGHNAEIDVETRTSKNFDLRRELLEGRVEVRTKTDWLPMYCADASKRASFLYGQFSVLLVGDCENWGYAQPVKNLSLTTFKCILDNYAILIKDDRTEVARGDLPTTWGKGYNCFHLRLKEASVGGWGALEVSPISKDEPPASSGNRRVLVFLNKNNSGKSHEEQIPGKIIVVLRTHNMFFPIVAVTQSLQVF